MFLRTLLIGALFFSFYSCSSNDTFGPALPREEAADYFPLDMHHRWEYNNKLNDSLTTTEVLKVKDSVVEFDEIGYSFSSDQSPASRSLTTNLLANGILHNITGRVVYNGSLNLYLPIFEDSLKIPISNLVLIKQNAPNQEKIAEVRDSVLQTYTANHKNFSLFLKYRVQSFSDKSFDEYTIGDSVYEHVLSGKLVVDLQILLNHESSSPISILPEQQVASLHNYYIQDVGLGQSHEKQEFRYEHLESLNLSGDSTYTKHLQQNLIGYDKD